MKKQEQDCRTYASKYGFEIVGIFGEYGSGVNLLRPQLQSLLTYCRNRKNTISTVIVTDIERISRNTSHFILIKSELKQISIQIESAKETDNFPLVDLKRIA